MIHNLKEKLSERLYRNFAEEFACRVMAEPEIFPGLYALVFNGSPKTAWRAAWVCEKISCRFPEWFMDKRSELMRHIMYIAGSSRRRTGSGRVSQLLPGPHAFAAGAGCHTGVVYEDGIRALPERTGAFAGIQIFTGKCRTGILFQRNAECDMQYVETVEITRKRECANARMHECAKGRMRETVSLYLPSRFRAFDLSRLCAFVEV